MNKDIPEQQIPTNPIIEENTNSNLNHRETLDRVVGVLQFLTEQSLSENLSSEARYGRYWIQRMLIDSINYVNDALNNKTMND